VNQDDVPNTPTTNADPKTTNAEPKTTNARAQSSSTPRNFNAIQEEIKKKALEQGPTFRQLKRKKLDLQVDLLKLEKRKRLLEIYELEERMAWSMKSTHCRNWG